MNVLTEMGFYAILRFKETLRLFLQHFKGNPLRFVAEEVTIGISFGIVALIGKQTLLGDYEGLLRITFAGMGIWLLLIFIWYYFRAPSSLFFEQKRRADLFTESDLDIDPFNPNESDLQPSGFLVRNNKSIPIDISARMLGLWHGRVAIAKENLPHPIAWLKDEGLVFGSIQIPPGNVGHVVLEHIPTVQEQSAIKLVARVTSSEEAKRLASKESIGIEFGGDLGIPIYEGEKYQAEIDFKFEINGVDVHTQPKRIALSFREKKLIVNYLQPPGFLYQIRDSVYRFLSKYSKSKDSS